MLEYLRIAAQMLDVKVVELDKSLVKYLNDIEKLMERNNGHLRSRQIIALAIETWKVFKIIGV